MDPNSTIVQGVVEEVIQPFWDTFLYPAAGQGTTPAIMFQLAKGQGKTAFGGSVGTAASTLRDTNMQIGGALPGGFTLFVHAISVVLAAETPAQSVDVSKVLNGGVLILSVGQKIQHQQPLVKLPGGGGITGVGASAVGATPLEQHVYNNGVPDPRAVYSIAQKYVTIPPSINFDVTLVWPSGGVAIATALPITVLLEGVLQRPTQ